MKYFFAYLEFVSALVVLEVPAAAGDDHDDLLLAEAGEGAVQQDLELGGHGVVGLQDRPRHLVHRRAGGRPRVRSRRGLVCSGPRGLLRPRPGAQTQVS